MLRRSLLPILALVLLAVSPGASATPAGAAHYLGRWNYDQPDYATMTNIAEINVPGGRQIPQIGDIVYTEESGRIVGRTDVGCTWRFRATSGALALDPPGQLCHNPTLNVAYTITSWTVTVTGNRQRESIEAISHNQGHDFAFVLRNGARTRAGTPNIADFTGSWTYSPADSSTGINIRQTITNGQPTATQEQGTTRIVSDYENRITARTPDNCTWSLIVRGNTAKLDPPVQTCADVTLDYWTITSDGHEQFTIMTGTDQNGGDFTISKGSLTKRL